MKMQRPDAAAAFLTAGKIGELLPGASSKQRLDVFNEVRMLAKAPAYGERNISERANQ